MKEGRRKDEEPSGAAKKGERDEKKMEPDARRTCRTASSFATEISSLFREHIQSVRSDSLKAREPEEKTTERASTYSFFPSSPKGTSRCQQLLSRSVG